MNCHTSAGSNSARDERAAEIKRAPGSQPHLGMIATQGIHR